MAKYPFADLKEADDAFDVPVASTSAAALGVACHSAGKRLGRRFSYRSIPEAGVYEVSLAAPAIEITKKREKAQHAGGGSGTYAARVDEAAARLRRPR